MNKIIICLWFDNQAEQAAKFYTTIFQNQKIETDSNYVEEELREKETLLAVNFQLNGQEFMALNGGPLYKFTPAISLFVNCENQDEVDYYWERLSQGGEKGQCGWLTDKFGISWQIVPTILGTLMNDKDENKVARVTHAMLQMRKLEIEKLKDAYERG
jgi:predicted 3-demethylubiquinone-9 3-methyltransferase (glyoxalase superfamily)